MPQRPGAPAPGRTASLVDGGHEVAGGIGKLFLEGLDYRSGRTNLLDQAHAHRRDAVLAAANDAGLMTRPLWRPMHLLTMYASAPRMDLSVTEDLHARLINLPSSPALARTSA